MEFFAITAAGSATISDQADLENSLYGIPTVLAGIGMDSRRYRIRQVERTEWLAPLATAGDRGKCLRQLRVAPNRSVPIVGCRSRLTEVLDGWIWAPRVHGGARGVHKGRELSPRRAQFPAWLVR